MVYRVVHSQISNRRRRWTYHVYSVISATDERSKEMEERVCAAWIICTNGRILEGYIYPGTNKELLERSKAEGSFFKLIIDQKYDILEDKPIVVKDIWQRIA